MMILSSSSMAQIQDSPKKQHHHKSSSSSNCFVGCFGFSESPYKLKEKASKNSTKTTLSNIISWFSRSKKSSERTLLVDDSASEKLHQRKESFRMAKLSKKFSTNPKRSPENVPAATSQIPAATGDKSVHGKAKKTRYENAQKIILENSKNLNHLDSIMKEATCKKGLSRRNSSSQPMSPEDKHLVSRHAGAVLSHSTSMPPPSTANNLAVNGGNGYSQVKKEPPHKKKNLYAGKFDQLVGMSIIVVTLLIMIVWGKLCAILFTSAWLYFYPLIITTKNNESKDTIRNGSKSLDIDSQEHKKKVVLGGFLERNHRINGVGIL